MKIAIDLRPLQIGHQNRGIGMYLLNILKYMPSDAEYIFLRFDSSDPVDDYNLSNGTPYEDVVVKRVGFSRKPIGLIRFIVYLLTPKFSRIKQLCPDIFFQTDYLLGVPHKSSIQTIVVAYDLIPLRFRSMYLPHWKKYLHYAQFRVRARIRLMVRAYYYQSKYNRGLRTLRHADKVISISETTTKDLKSIARVNPGNIQTIYLAPSFLTGDSSGPTNSTKKTIEPIKGNYLVFVGGTDLRRRAHELVFAFNLLNARGIEMHLVLAGNEFVEDSKEINPIAKKAIESSSYRERIHLMGKISEADKLYVLQNAFAFVYPTIFEGFGLPLLEAMHAHCPVITFRNEATQEIAQEAAIYTRSDDGIGILEAVLAILNDPAERTAMIRRGDARYPDFSWDSTGQQTVDYMLK